MSNPPAEKSSILGARKLAKTSKLKVAWTGFSHYLKSFKPVIAFIKLYSWITNHCYTIYVLQSCQSCFTLLFCNPPCCDLPFCTALHWQSSAQNQLFAYLFSKLTFKGYFSFTYISVGHYKYKGSSKNP